MGVFLPNLLPGQPCPGQFLFGITNKCRWFFRRNGHQKHFEAEASNRSIWIISWQAKKQLVPRLTIHHSAWESNGRDTWMPIQPIQKWTGLPLFFAARRLPKNTKGEQQFWIFGRHPSLDAANVGIRIRLERNQSLLWRILSGRYTCPNPLLLVKDMYIPPCSNQEKPGFWSVRPIYTAITQEPDWNTIR